MGSTSRGASPTPPINDEILYTNNPPPKIWWGKRSKLLNSLSSWRLHANPLLPSPPPPHRPTLTLDPHAFPCNSARQSCNASPHPTPAPFPFGGDCTLAAKLVSSVAAALLSEAGITLVVHNKPKGEDGHAQVDEVLAVVTAGSLTVGMVAKEAGEGAMTVYAAAALKATDSAAAMVEVGPGLADAMTVKDDSELSLLKKAAHLSTKVGVALGPHARSHDARPTHSRGQLHQTPPPSRPSLDMYLTLLNSCSNTCRQQHWFVFKPQPQPEPRPGVRHRATLPGPRAHCARVKRAARLCQARSWCRALKVRTCRPWRGQWSKWRAL